MPSPKPPPTADQVARIIVAAARETGADPFEVPKPAVSKSAAVVRARVYAAFALRKLFTEVPMPTIGRMLGEAHPPYVSIIYSKVTKGQFAWFDMEALQRVMAAAGVSLPAEPEIARTAPAAPARAIPEAEERTNRPDFETKRPERTSSPDDFLPKRTYSHADFAVPPSKRALRDQLRQAVETTAKMPSQN